jgi:hypothetical protein
MSDKIKMSVLFGGVDTASISMINLVVGSTPERRMGAIVAINAYDDNQSLIERYQKLVCQTCDGHGAVGNILDSMDCPDCTLAISATDYVEQLQGSLKTQYKEIDELRAMVNDFRESLSKNQEWVRCGIGGNCGGYPQDHKDYIAITELLNKTPAQCVASVKADAVKSFGVEIGLYNSEYDDQEFIEVSRHSLREHIDNLRGEHE